MSDLMNDLTPERIRDAAEVHHLLNVAANVSDDYSRNVTGLLRIADEMERKAKQGKRVADLAAELRDLYSTPTAAWADIARALLERYPALADPGPCDKGPCCLANHHEGRCEL